MIDPVFFAILIVPYLVYILLKWKFGVKRVEYVTGKVINFMWSFLSLIVGSGMVALGIVGNSIFVAIAGVILFVLALLANRVWIVKKLSRNEQTQSHII